ncbi:MAG: tyrosine-type recombinase/integrase [Clostridiaceae bacterium]|nr:tyrosine-type recombinase/integrase [Clostridiaceae bacterium]
MILIDEFGESLTKSGASSSTINSYLADLILFESFCREKGLCETDKISSEDISRYFQYLCSLGRASSTIRRARSSLNSYFIFLMKNNMSENNPVKGIEMSKEKKGQTLPVLTHAEIEKLLSFEYGTSEKGLRNKAMIELLYATGIKISSLIAIKVSDYSPEYKMILAEGRRIPLYSSANDSLLSYLSYSRPFIASQIEDSLFVSLQGTSVSRQGLWKILRKIAEDAGIQKKLTPQLMRRSFAIHLLENGAGPREVGKMLGLSDRASVMNYVKMMQGDSITEDYRRFHPRAKK